MQTHRVRDEQTEKKIRLTKIWLGLLAFNLFINLDLVDAWLNEADKQTPRFVAAQLECSTSGAWQLPQQDHVWKNQPYVAFGLTSEEQPSSGLAMVAVDLSSKKKQSSLSFDPRWGALTQTDPLLSSGLSPPLAA